MPPILGDEGLGVDSLKELLHPLPADFLILRGERVEPFTPRLLPLAFVASPAARYEISTSMTVAGEVAFDDAIEHVIPSGPQQLRNRRKQGLL
jgi:hypothetical protein